MRKVLFILLAGLFLTACGSEEPEVIEEAEEVAAEPEEIENAEEVEREPLPFDKDEFIDKYFEIAGDDEEIKNSMKLSVKEESITLTFGTMLEAQILLSALNEFMQDEMIDELTDELIDSLLEYGNYKADFTTSGLHIYVDALDINSVMVTVISE